MVYVIVKENTKEKLHLSREPSTWSWGLLFGFTSFGLGAAYYGQDHIIWEIIYVTLGVCVGISCMEDWEDCEFDKTKGEIRLKRISAWDRILSPFVCKEHVVIANISEVSGVEVEEQNVNFVGKSYQVVLQFTTGMSLGITDCFTFGSDKEHTEIAEKIRTFLDLNNPDRPINTGFQDDENYQGDDSSSEDDVEDFEKVEKSELIEEEAPSQEDDAGGPEAED